MPAQTRKTTPSGHKGIVPPSGLPTTTSGEQLPAARRLRVLRAFLFRVRGTVTLSTTDVRANQAKRAHYLQDV